MENSLTTRTNAADKFTEPQELLLQLAKLDVKEYLLNSGTNKLQPAKKEDILTVLEKLCVLKNISLDEIQSTGIICELESKGFTKEQLYNAYERILPMKLWNNEIGIELFLDQEEAQLFAITQKAKEMLSAMLNDKITSIKHYERINFPYDIMTEYINKEKELQNLKAKLLKDFKETLDSAIIIDSTLLEKYFTQTELKTFKKLYNGQTA